MPAEALINRICREFPETFGRDEATARSENKRYFITRVLGQGATGLVLQAKKTEDNASYAVKIVDLEGMGEADRARAMAEVHCLLNCDFFSIVKCHEDLIRYNPDNSKEPQIIALVIDFANAGDLRQEIKNRAKNNRPFREHEAGLLFLQVLMAVHHVHSRHMIHRDIKSANILLCCNGLIKLGDFGFSKMYSGSVSENVGKTFCGTPYYVAPEIWRRSAYSKKADMFSLGVLLYELLALKRPFDGQNVNEVMERTLSGVYDPLPETITEEMRNVVSTLLSSDPQKRPTSGKLLSSPICKLFIDGLVGIVQTQPAFEDKLREMVKEQIQKTRASLHANAVSKRPQLQNDASDSNSSRPATTTTGMFATQDVIKGASLDERNIFCEGTIRKLSSDSQWKKRYLAIATRDVPAASGEAIRPDQFELVLAVSKDTIGQQCIATSFEELEDVFPVPKKYAGTGAPHVFAIAFKSGVKRLTFMAASEEDRDIWMAKIQEALGISEEE